MLNVIATGTFLATLEEDFIVTVRETKRPYCKAMISEFYEGTDRYPYTFVPLNKRIYPLKKGDTIKVMFFNNNVQYPILHSVEEDIPTSVTDPVTFPSGRTVTFPTPGDTFDFHYYSPASYTLYQDDMQIIHQGGSVFVIQDGSIVFSSDYIGLVSGNGFCVDNIGTFALTSNSQELCSIIDGLITSLTTFSTGLNPTTLPGQAAALTLELALATASLTAFKG